MKINHVTLIGAGGGGASLFGALAPAYDMTIHDGDIFEEGNVIRQMYASQGMGLNKADFLASLGNQGPRNITSSPRMVTGAEELETDLIFSCVDNNAGRQAAFTLANIHNVPLIIIANENWNPMAWLYMPDWEYDNRNPFIRWKLADLVEGRQESCSGEKVIEEIPQLPQANHVSAGMGLMIFQSMLMYKNPNNYVAEAMCAPLPSYLQVKDIELS
jgi:hypothetical protein